MKFLAGGILLLGVVGCSSDGSGNQSNTGGTGSTGGTGATGNCGTATPKLLYTSDNVVRGVVVDATSVYFVESIDEINKIPKAGGAKTAVATTPTFNSDVTVRLYEDGDKLYLSDNASLLSVDKAGGAPTALATSASTVAIGIDTGLAFDENYIYFGDKVAGEAGEALGTVNKVAKSGGTPTVLASMQAGPSSIVFDDTDLYWINEGTITSTFSTLPNGGLGSVPKAGGNAHALFSQASKDGISPSAGELLVAGSDLFFASVNVNNISNTGEYRLAKAGGAPEEFSSCPTLGAFIESGQMYANCGDRISKFDLATGDETELVCLPEALEGALYMTHDSSAIYYIKAEPSNSTSDSPYAIYSVPIQ